MERFILPDADVEVIDSAGANWGALDIDVGQLTWNRTNHAVRLSGESSCLCVVTEEIGGRVSFRGPNGGCIPAEHYGTGQMTLIPRPADVFLFSEELAECRIAVFRCDEVTTAGHAAGSRVMADDAALRICAGLLAQECRLGENPEGYALSLALAFREALRVAALRPIDRTAWAGQGFFATAARYIDDRLDEGIPIGDIAAVTGMPPGNVAREFARLAGVTPQRWQIEERIRWAQRLAKESSTSSFREIAQWTGFADQSHFSRTFIQVVGQTPSQWLRSRS